MALTVASTKEKVIMIEAGANEVPEQQMIDAIFAAHELNQKVIAFIDTIVAECGKEKHAYENRVLSESNLSPLLMDESDRSLFRPDACDLLRSSCGLSFSDTDIQPLRELQATPHSLQMLPLISQ